MRWSLVSVAVAASRIASADVELAWHAPAGCPDEAAIRDAIVRHLDAPPDRIELTVAIDVVADAEGFVARFAIGDEPRELTSASCGELAEAVAVVVAHAAVEAYVAPPPPPPAISKPVPAVAVVASVAATPSAPTWNAGVRVAMLAGHGYSPDAGAAGEVAAWASYRRFSAELAAERWWATTAEVAGGTGVEVGLSALAARAGWAPASHLRTWVVAEIGSQRGMGVGFTGASGGSGRWFAAGAGAGIHWPIAPHVAAVGAGEVEVALERTSFAVAAGTTVSEAPRLAERLRLGLELSWR